jgi:hypothetical protein
VSSLRVVDARLPTDAARCHGRRYRIFLANCLRLAIERGHEFSDGSSGNAIPRHPLRGRSAAEQE